MGSAVRQAVGSDLRLIEMYSKAIGIRCIVALRDLVACEFASRDVRKGASVYADVKPICAMNIVCPRCRVL